MREEGVMKRSILVLTVAIAAALVAPLAAQGGGDDDGLRVRLQLPVTFSSPTAACPEGIAEYGISTKRRTGLGTNCIQAVVPAACPPAAVNALFCQGVSVLATLRLRGGRIEADASIFEIWTCGDPMCLTLSVDQQWSGSVTRATGKFDDLEGGSISGGGTAVFDATTFEVLSIDQLLAIDEEDEDEEDD
jgi:hypothetical protein